MTNIEDTIVVFTARRPDRIVSEGGSQAWVLNPVRAKQCTWLLCTQNRHNPDHEFSDATEPHGTGFLLGRISAIRKSDEGKSERWIVAISEYARLSIPNAWDGSRNPVRYTSLTELGINLNDLDFLLMPEAAASTPTRERQAPALDARGAAPGTVLTIAEAKKQLAAAFGIKPDAIEITIRG
jgi:hypothetical protein